MSADDNADDSAALVRTLVEEFQRGDLAAVRGHFAPTRCGSSPAAAGWRASTEARMRSSGFLARCCELFGGTLRLDVRDVLAGTRVPRMSNS